MWLHNAPCTVFTFGHYADAVSFFASSWWPVVLLEASLYIIDPIALSDLMLELGKGRNHVVQGLQKDQFRCHEARGIPEVASQYKRAAKICRAELRTLQLCVGKLVD